MVVIHNQAQKKLASIQRQGGTRLQPEFYLWFSMLGSSISITISLFWMAWTSYPDISIWSPLVASTLFGFGLSGVFISIFLYVLDSYEAWAVSALAALTVVRYAAAGSMVVVGIPFYQNMRVHYTLTILASISAIFALVPYFFYAYGPRLRALCKYTRDD